MTDPLVSVEGLTFSYRRATEPAVRDLTQSVDPGEVILVAGPSGCGKSTLIRAINGLIPHAYPGEMTGTVLVAGRSTADRHGSTSTRGVLRQPDTNGNGGVARQGIGRQPSQIGGF